MTQLITIDTLMGPSQIKAPGGWEFDETAKNCWSMLLSVTREVNDSASRTKREQAVLEGQAHILAVLLARSLGMAAFYWEQEAKKLS